MFENKKLSFSQSKDKFFNSLKMLIVKCLRYEYQILLVYHTIVVKA